MQTLRTPDKRFAEIPNFPYSPRYCELDDDEGGRVRMAWIEDGPADADPILLLHGEPSWSFLYRKMIPALVAAGHRVVCPDLVGFGRSDKPTRREDYPTPGGEHPTIHGAGHFLQEDAGEELAGHIVRFLGQGAG